MKYNQIILTLNRFAYKDKYVISRLFVNGEYFCDVLENKEHIIPRGVYQIGMHPSPSQKCICPILKNVPRRSYILIHKGNKYFHSRGCLLVGYNTSVGSVLRSSDAFEKLMNVLKLSDNLSIEIFDYQTGHKNLQPII